MAKTKTFLSGLLGKAGNSVFRFLSRLEEKGFMPRAARWIKISSIGFIASLVVALSLKAEETQVLCYKVARMPEINIYNAAVSPNPTRGSDSVKISATAKVLGPTIKDNFIKDAWLSWKGDTTRIKVSALDGKMNDTLEILEGRLYVGNLANGPNSASLIVETSQGALESYWVSFEVSQPDSVDSDTTK